MQTTKFFKHGRSQAVRIPRNFDFEEVMELTVQKMGQMRSISPRSMACDWKTWFKETA